MKAPFKKVIAASVTVSLLCGFAPPSFADNPTPPYSLNSAGSLPSTLEGYALDRSPIGGGTSGVEPQAAPILFWLGSLAIRLSAHAVKQAAARGVSQHMIKQVILNGARTHGNNNTWIYTSGNIRVIVNKTTGNVVTVTKG